MVCPGPKEREAWVAALERVVRAAGAGLEGKKVRVLVNPFSGNREARAIWQECSQLFKLAGVTVETTETAYTRHAKEIASQIDTKEYHAIVTVSGDGLLNEVVNGLMERPDWQQALQILVGAIPAGSGNGLAATLGSVDPLTIAFNIVKGRQRKIDLMHAVLAKSHFYCFLSVTWALISDIDLESESYRWMGPARFTVAAVVRYLRDSCRAS